MTMISEPQIYISVNECVSTIQIAVCAVTTRNQCAKDRLRGTLNVVPLSFVTAITCCFTRLLDNINTKYNYVYIGYAHFVLYLAYI